MRQVICIPVALLLWATSGCLANADDWSGLYGGVHVGRAYTDLDGIGSGGAVPLDFSLMNLDRHVAGGQLGFQHQVGRWVFGIESDYSWHGAEDGDCDSRAFFSTIAECIANFQDVVTVKSKALQSLRVRAGLTVGQLLFYGTAGWGWLQADAHFTTHEAAAGNARHDDSIKLDANGAVYGGGVEWMLQSTGLSLRLDYLHYGLGQRTMLSNPPISETVPGNSINIDDFDVIRVGVSYQINIDPFN